MTAPSRRKARLRALALTGLAGTAWAAAPPVAANTVAPGPALKHLNLKTHNHLLCLKSGEY